MRVRVCFSGTNQKPERRRPFGTGLVRHCPQGLFSPFFTFLRAIFFRPFRLSLVPTICPWVSEDEDLPKCTLLGGAPLSLPFSLPTPVPTLTAPPLITSVSSDLGFFSFVRVKMLKEVPYTPEEAERAAGMGSYTLTSTKPLLPVDQDEEMKSGENIENLDT